MGRLLRSWVFGAAVAVAGGVVLYLGSRIDGYAVGVLQNVGVALVLFPLLILAERAFEKLLARTVEAVRADVEGRVGEIREEVTAALDQLSQATQDQLRQARDDDEQSLRRFTEKSNAADLSALFRRAAELDAISQHGVRVRIPGTVRTPNVANLSRLFRRALANASELRLRFQSAALMPIAPAQGVELSAEAFLVETETADGRKIGQPMVWEPEQAAPVFARRLAEKLTQHDYPGGDAFDASAVFGHLRDTLALGIRARTGAAGWDRQVGPILETLPNGFVITDRGLFRIDGRGNVESFSIKQLELSNYPPDTHKSREDLEEPWSLARALLLPPPSGPFPRRWKQFLS